MTHRRQTTRPRAKTATRRAADHAEAAPLDQPAAAPETMGTAASATTAANPKQSLVAEGATAPALVRLTKGARLLDMLATPEGAMLDSLCRALDWQAQTVRAALTRLRQAGHAVERSKTGEGETVYRIIPGHPDGPAGTQQAEQTEATPTDEAEAMSLAPLAPEVLDGGAA